MAERKTITINREEYDRLLQVKEFKESFAGVRYDWGQFLLSMASDSGGAAIWLTRKDRRSPLAEKCGGPSQ